MRPSVPWTSCVIGVRSLRLHSLHNDGAALPSSLGCFKDESRWGSESCEDCPWHPGNPQSWLWWGPPPCSAYKASPSASPQHPHLSHACPTRGTPRIKEQSEMPSLAPPTFTPSILFLALCSAISRAVLIRQKASPQMGWFQRLVERLRGCLEAGRWGWPPSHPSF